MPWPRDWVSDKRAQVAVVDPQQGGVHVKRDLEFVGVVHLDQHIQAQLKRASLQVSQTRGLECRHDQQDTVRTHRTGGDDLIGIDDKVLAQHGQRACGACLSQVVVRPLEKLHVSEHGQARRTMRCIGGCNGGRLKVLTQYAFGGRRFFDFSDDARLASRDLFLDGLGKSTDILAGLRLAQQVSLTA